MAKVSGNFAFLAKHDELLVQLASLAERYFTDDPNTSLIKLRQFAEALAQQVAASAGVWTSDDETQADLLRRLKYSDILPRQSADLFHAIRKAGNAATHEHTATHAQALQHLKLARQLAIWFHRSFGREPGFKAGAFVPPQPPDQADAKLAKELVALRAELDKARTAAERAEAAAEEEAIHRLSAEEQAKQAEEDRAFWEIQAEEAEQRITTHKEVLAVAQAEAEKKPAAELQAQRADAKKADDDIDPDEASTRVLIDEQLRCAGWECDSERYTYANGTRPHKTRYIAISEWPTASGPADYALFCGMTCVAIVEAKRLKKDVPAVLQQTKRYSRDFTDHDDVTLPTGSPWGEYRVPFIFATNSRPYLRQVKTKSGIWFWDARHPTRQSRHLANWYSPKGLLGLLKQDEEAANAKLKTEPLEYLQLRDYQTAAIQSVETAIEAGQRECLLAMATGTGKTRTAIGLVYRLVKSGRFRRVLFLVDRSSLGHQAGGAFRTVKLEQLKSFGDIYGIQGFEDEHAKYEPPEDDTRLHLATIQSLVHQLLYSTDDSNSPTVDQYDCIVIDEAHRGYTLDKEMSDAEMGFRSESDYISKYRRVLDHFDATKVALTATPALHTTEIFGDPVYTYGYRDAVIDGYLVDHEPPYRIVTKLADQGIGFKAGEEVQAYNPNNEQLDLIHMPDDVDFEIEGFNRNVITENFNKTVCEELARHIDPNLPGKTLIFCLNRAHADLFVTSLKEALTEQYGEIDDDAVARITGDIDRPLEMIRRYKNEQLPKFAVTVDLLTTGIDVPEITNLVFVRRVRSRILYEQMVGRATRLCPDIGKDYFRIFDFVDIYSALAPFTDMKPVVQSTSITFQQLVRELDEVQDDTARQEVFDQLIAKLQASTRRLKGTRLEEFCELADTEPKAMLKKLRKGTAEEATTFFKDHPGIVTFLDTKQKGGRASVYISDHDDEIKTVERGYGDNRKPEDYLDGFKAFINDNLNTIPALLTVTQRPRELTREQLKEVKRALDKAGYNLAALRTAHRQVTNQDIAASIIGFIRQKALGEPLISYSERVEAAMKTIMSSQPWTDVQRKWLARIGKQLQKEVLVDRASLDRGAFLEQGGFKRYNKIFGDQMEELLGDINQALWEKTG